MWSIDGSIQRLLKDEKFVELLRQTERQIADNSVILQENGSNEIIEGILDLSSDFCSIFYIIAERRRMGGSFIVGLAGMSPQEYPVLGEVFTFLESLFACVVDKDVIYMAVQACQSFLKGGICFCVDFVIIRCCWYKRKNEYEDSRINREWNEAREVW